MNKTDFIVEKYIKSKKQLQKKRVLKRLNKDFGEIKKSGKKSFIDWVENNITDKIMDEYDDYFSEYSIKYGEKYLKRNHNTSFYDDPSSYYYEISYKIGYPAEREAAKKIIKKYSKRFDYKHGDENDKDKQLILASKIVDEVGFYKGYSDIYGY